MCVDGTVLTEYGFLIGCSNNTLFFLIGQEADMFLSVAANLTNTNRMAVDKSDKKNALLWQPVPLGH